jgi:uncharacterized repeat protein (TIGR03803 family)
MTRAGRLSSVVSFLAVLLSGVSAMGQGYQVSDVYDFETYSAAMTPTLQGADGNLYGTASYGEDGSYIYKVTPLGVGSAVYTFPTIGGVNATLSSLIFGTDGNFYGTTANGGANSAGSLYKVTASGTYTLLHSFSTSDGSYPQGLVQGQDGKLYGTTTEGTSGNFGAFYSYDLISSTYTELYGFTYPLTQGPVAGPLVQGTDGNFYGAVGDGNNGSGGIFKISPAGVYKSLFEGGPQYNFSTWSPLVEGPDGYFYGWVSDTDGDGLTAIYKINSSGVGGLVHEFPAGAVPPASFGGAAPLTLGSDGKLYGAYYAVPQYEQGELFFFSLTTDGKLQQELAFTPGYGPNYTALTQGTDGSFYTADTAGSFSSIYRFGNALGTAPILAGPVNVSVTPSVIAPGESATLTWSVSNAFGQSANLCFGSGAWSGVQLSSGSMTVSPAAGNYSYGLTCGGVESGFAGLTVGGNRASSETTLLAAPSSVMVGGALQVIATVNSSSGSGPSPTGNVTFTANGATLFNYPVTTNAADATFSTATLAPGSYLIGATYNGDSNYQGSSAKTQPAVQVQGTPTLTMTATPNPVGQGYPLKLGVIVPAVNNGPTPTGTVVLSVNGMTLGTYPLQGGKILVTTKTSTTEIGYDSALATYNGDANYLTAQGNVQFTVIPNASVALTVSPNPLVAGQSATLLANVSESSDQVPPTGTVTFNIPGFAIGTAKVSNGSAVLSASSAGVPPGTYPVTATYNGDMNNGPATSPPVSVKITAK